jgi:hypothetical protein
MSDLRKRRTVRCERPVRRGGRTGSGNPTDRSRRITRSSLLVGPTSARPGESGIVYRIRNDCRDYRALIGRDSPATAATVSYEVGFIVQAEMASQVATLQRITNSRRPRHSRSPPGRTRRSQRSHRSRPPRPVATLFAPGDVVWSSGFQADGFAVGHRRQVGGLEITQPGR